MCADFPAKGIVEFEAGVIGVDVEFIKEIKKASSRSSCCSSLRLFKKASQPSHRKA